MNEDIHYVEYEEVLRGAQDVQDEEDDKRLHEEMELLKNYYEMRK